jgi:hypothetical protein
MSSGLFTFSASHVGPPPDGYDPPMTPDYPNDGVQSAVSFLEQRVAIRYSIRRRMALLEIWALIVAGLGGVAAAVLATGNLAAATHLVWLALPVGLGVLGLISGFFLSGQINLRKQDALEAVHRDAAKLTSEVRNALDAAARTDERLPLGAGSE